MSYICISHAAADQAYADRLCRELTKYGFGFVCVHETTPKDKREAAFLGSCFLLVMTSPAAETSGSCATDLRRAAGMGLPCVCVSVHPNKLDARYCATEDAIPKIPYPAGETDTPDEMSVALYIHRLYIKHLSGLLQAFSPVRCADDTYGRAITYAYKAKQGDVEAQYALGCAYEAGAGLPVMEEEAARWIRMAAEADHTDALIRMGELLLDGEGVERDPTEALQMFSRAAKLGNAAGQFAKGICCLYGYGLMKDPEMALRYFKAAAGQGYIPAFYRMGLLYRDGVGTPKNHRLAVKYLYMAAGGGNEDTPYLYGERFSPRPGRKKKFLCVSLRFMRQKTLEPLLRARLPELTEENRESLKFCKKWCRGKRKDYPENRWLYEESYHFSPARKGDYAHKLWNPALAESALGRLLEEGDAAAGIKPSPRAALLWYRRAARHGHPGAIFRLGDAYRSGRGVLKDAFQAMQLFLRAAELGSRRGQFAMGVCCERGEGTACDPEAAVTWYEMAAKEGYAPAQNNLGGCYEHGFGVSMDHAAAVEWYTRASVNGESNATCRLGLCYEFGRGVTQNVDRAFHLYETAAKHRHPYALYRLGLFYDRGITRPAQVAYAAHLYRRAAMSGVGAAAYAMALCCGEGRGVRKSADDSLEWLKISASLGCVQGAYALGMAYYEGRKAVHNRRAAQAEFEHCIASYAAMSDYTKRDADVLYPTDGISMTEAAGKALYMLGYLCLSDGGDTNAALSYFKRAARLGSGVAMTAIGDLYEYGLVDTGDPQKNRKAALSAYGAAADNGQAEAHLSLAKYHSRRADEAEARGDVSEAERLRRETVKNLRQGEESGNLYAAVGLAGCEWLGYGVKKDKNAAYTRLRRMMRETEGEEGQGRINVMAALWLGDIFRLSMELNCTPEEKMKRAKNAYRAYLWAEKAPLLVSVETKYLLPVRMDALRALEEKAQSEARYRLAVLSMTHFDHKISGDRIYARLGAAVISGHEEALSDLTRLFLHEKYIKANPPDIDMGKKKRYGGKKNRETISDIVMLRTFGKLYYGTKKILPEPFTLSALRSTGEDARLPEYMTRPLTDTMRAEALNRLGDRYFYGQDIPEDRASAVACYRRAASVVQPRDEAVSGGIVWAQYSMGYCKLYGLGTSKDAREAVRYLTKAAKYHGEAALCLAKCHLEGVGVDRSDRLEALKYYRRAFKLGCFEAERMVNQLEAEIREENE